MGVTRNRNSKTVSIGIVIVVFEVDRTDHIAIVVNDDDVCFCNRSIVNWIYSNVNGYGISIIISIIGFIGEGIRGGFRPIVCITKCTATIERQVSIGWIVDDNCCE